jgi:hypothetical protein
MPRVRVLVPLDVDVEPELLEALRALGNVVERSRAAKLPEAVGAFVRAARDVGRRRRRARK